ncbi:MAG TPA: GNAT family N-acetyltransferase [Terriglobales bacterium]|nr:GNAT family N-acetyltransferase [Terriglobales bacterium]
MAVPAVLSLRPAIQDDRSRLANLLHFESHVHRHLDWRRPLDWLGASPFVVVESAGPLNAALACPPDPPGIGWIRLFAVDSRMQPGKAWETLWPEATQELKDLGVDQAAAIPLDNWFRKLVSNSGFEHIHSVVVLEWKAANSVASKQALHIRAMQPADIAAVHAVDAAAFAPLWQNSEAALTAALKQAGHATVIEENGEIVAYQISTQSNQGLHLARLATHPKQQGQGLAKALVQDVQQKLVDNRWAVLSVNTQDNNNPSLSLYDKMGFTLNGEQFPIYHLELK